MQYNIDKDILPSLHWITENPEKQNPKVEIFYFALTTCFHCKKGLNWLREKEVTFQWMYLDQQDRTEKMAIKEWIKAKYHTNMGMPTVIFRKNGQDFISDGFDPEYWKSKI